MVRITINTPMIRAFIAFCAGSLGDCPESGVNSLISPPKKGKIKCGERDLNPHPLRDQILSLARLPVSPSPQTNKRIKHAPSRDRTYDPVIKSHLLYQLSYRRIKLNKVSVVYQEILRRTIEIKIFKRLPRPLV